jgi:hypothetical protein
MKTQSQYTVFVGDINELKATLNKAAEEGRKPILISSVHYVEGTAYTIVFEQTVLQGN